MRRKWTVLIVALFLAVAVAAERVSAYYVSKLVVRRRALENGLEEATVRTLRAKQEKVRYDEVERLAKQVESAVRWEPDSTNLLRWFADMAAAEGVRLLNSKLRPYNRTGKDSLVGEGKLRRIGFDVVLEGGFRPLVQFVERVERTPHVMLIERLSLSAVRSSPGMGELKITVSCLSPAPVEDAQEGGDVQ